MVRLTESLIQWLWRYDKTLLAPIMLGRVELMTDEMWDQYIEWCKTEEGRQYLQGGSKYKEPQ
jgi:hypothetical protein